MVTWCDDHGDRAIVVAVVFITLVIYHIVVITTIVIFHIVVITIDQGIVLTVAVFLVGFIIGIARGCFSKLAWRQLEHHTE
jgi:hypothetical protein